MEMRCGGEPLREACKQAANEKPEGYTVEELKKLQPKLYKKLKKKIDRWEELRWKLRYIRMPHYWMEYEVLCYDLGVEP